MSWRDKTEWKRAYLACGQPILIPGTAYDLLSIAMSNFRAPLNVASKPPPKKTKQQDTTKGKQSSKESCKKDYNWEWTITEKS